MERGESVDELAALLTKSVRILNGYATYSASSFRSIKVKFQASSRDASNLTGILNNIKPKLAELMIEPKLYQNGGLSCHVIEVSYSDAAQQEEIIPDKEEFRAAVRLVSDTIEEYALSRFLPGGSSDRSYGVKKT